MENYRQPIFENSGLDETGKYYLLETVRWTKFLAILSMIFLGILVLFGLMMIMGSAFMARYNAVTGVPGFVVGFIYLIACGLYFYPILCLFKFSSNIKNGIAANSNDMINEGFRYQKNMYKYIGIFMIIILSFYLLALIFGIFAAMLGR